MELKQINKVFKGIGEKQIRYRWLILAAVIILTGTGIAGLGRVHLESSNTSWFDDSDIIQKETDEFEERFGNNDTIGVLVEAENVFDHDVLTMIRELGEELLNKIPYADDVTSLTELEISVGNEEGIAVINPIGDIIPKDKDKLNEIQKFVLSRESVVNKLVSANAAETWISVSLREYPKEGEWPDPDLDPMFEAGEAAIKVVTDPRWKSDKWTIKAAGMPYTETEEKHFMGKEASLRVFSGFAVMLILLIVFLRSLRGVIVPAFTTVAGIVLVFGFMGWFGIGINSMLMTLPLLLGMALSVGYAIHLVNAFKTAFRATGKRRESMIRAVEKTGWPILFTVLTTMGSMLSFTVIDMAPVRWLGLTCAAVVLAVYLYVIVLIPILFSFGKDKPVKSISVNTKTEKFFFRMGEYIITKRRLIGVIFIITVIVSIPGMFLISVNIDSFKFMGLKIDYIKRLHSIANSNLGSYLNYNITVTFDEPDAVKDPAVLKNLEIMLDRVGDFEMTKKTDGVPKIFSILDIVREMNRTLNEDDEEFYTIPDNRELIAQLLFLYEISGGTHTYDWVDEEFSVIRAQVEIPRFDSTTITSELDAITAMGRELFPDAKVSAVGSAVRFAAMNNRVVIGELKSFLSALFIIALLLSLVFGSFKTGFIGLIPNITPVIAIGGIMGYFNMQLDMMTMIIMPMLLGIAVDDTIHFINQIKYEFEMCGDYRQAILRAFSSIGLTLAMTTIILSLSFGAYIFSPIQTMRNVGLLAPIGLISALIADYLITPLLVFVTRPFGRDVADNSLKSKIKISGAV